MYQLTCEFTESRTQNGKTGNFYRYNIDNKVRFWFSDEVDEKGKHYILQVYTQVLDNNLKGFEIYIDMDEDNFYYQSIRISAPHFVGSVKESQQFIEKLELIADLCDIINSFFMSEYPEIRKLNSQGGV